MNKWIIYWVHVSEAYRWAPFIENEQNEGRELSLLPLVFFLVLFFIYYKSVLPIFWVFLSAVFGLNDFVGVTGDEFSFSFCVRGTLRLSGNLSTSIYISGMLSTWSWIFWAISFIIVSWSVVRICGSLFFGETWVKAIGL